jgi:hypothetical protein
VFSGTLPALNQPSRYEKSSPQALPGTGKWRLSMQLKKVGFSLNLR